MFLRHRGVQRAVRWLLILLVVQWAAGFGLSRLARRHLLRILPEGTRIGSVHWRWPVGVTVRDLSLPDPSGRVSFLLKLKQGDFNVPVWGIWARPTPVRMTLHSPYAQMHSGNIYPVVQSMGLRPQRWLPVPLWEMEPSEPFPFAPISIRIIDGRLDALGEEIRAGHPVFTAAHVHLDIGLTAFFPEPVLTLAGSGHFVSERDQIIGLQSMSAQLNPRRRYGKGTLRLRHERLGDFKRIYQYAPRPILIDSGTADTVLSGEVFDGRHVKLTARCLVQNLDMTGRVGDVTWRQIMHAVEDEGRRYEWEVQVEGDLDDPHFNPHDRILREVEFLMKEKAASRGLAIRDPMFFYADTPAGEGPMEAEPE